MFHVTCWLSGYGWGKLGEVKLPYNPVNSTLRETWRKENTTNTQHPLADMRRGDSVKGHVAQINKETSLINESYLLIPRFPVLDSWTGNCYYPQCSEGK